MCGKFSDIGQVYNTYYCLLDLCDDNPNLFEIDKEVYATSCEQWAYGASLYYYDYFKDWQIYFLDFVHEVSIYCEELTNYGFFKSYSDCKAMYDCLDACYVKYDKIDHPVYGQDLLRC